MTPLKNDIGMVHFREGAFQFFFSNVKFLLIQLGLSIHAVSTTIHLTRKIPIIISI